MGLLVELEVDRLPGRLGTQRHGEEQIRIHGTIFPGPALSRKPPQADKDSQEP
jgi:hypothetical protein